MEKFNNKLDPAKEVTSELKATSNEIIQNEVETNRQKKNEIAV